MFHPLELVDKDELFPAAPVHPAYRIGAYTLGGERDLGHEHAGQLDLGADLTFYSKPAVLDAAYGNLRVSFHIFLRLRPGNDQKGHHHMRAAASAIADEDSAQKNSSGRFELKENPGMRNTLKLLRTLQLTLLGSVVLYAIVGEVVGPLQGSANPTLSYVLTTVGVAVVGMILVIRRTLVLRSATTLAEKPEDGLTLNHWKTGYIATYALCETLALFGLILRFMGFGFQQSLPFYVGGFVLLFFFGPREPSKQTA